MKRIVSMAAIAAIAISVSAATDGAPRESEGPLPPNRKSQRYYRLKFADTYYGEMTHYGLYRLAWADVRRAR